MTNELVIPMAELKAAGSHFEIGELLKSKGVPMVLSGLEWEFDFINYNIDMYYDDDDIFFKAVWSVKGEIV